jgi:hypothetical protein
MNTTPTTRPRVEPDMIIRFPDGRQTYTPGELLTAELSVANWSQLDCLRAEASVVWHTVGKGDEDLHVHYFKRLNAKGDDAIDLSTPYVVEVTLPESPLSYDGVIVKVCWCVRLRLFLDGFRQSLFEAPFRLGDVISPAPREPEGEE